MMLNRLCLFLTILGAQAFVVNGNVVNRRAGERLGIFNGNTTSISKYPFMAAFFDGKTFFGSGVILNNHWILTAGFNVIGLDLSQIEFRVGSGECDNGGQLLTATDVKIYENYTGKWDYDIAVVKVKNMKMGKTVKAAKLGKKNLKAMTEVKIAGWGARNESAFYNKQLLDATLTVLSWKTCKSYYPNDLSERMMCTFDKNTSPYYDDFGDPIVKDGKVFGLWAGYDGQSSPALFTNIPSYLEWIKQAIKE